MKTISPQLKSHLQGETTSICTCWKVTRRDGVTQGFTDLDVDVVYASLTYAAAAGYKRTAVETNDSFDVDNLTVEGILNSSYIDAGNVRKGLYDYAEIEVFIINYKDTSMGILPLRKGWLGEVILTQKGTFNAEMRGLTQTLNTQFGTVYASSCNADLGDSRCKVVLASHTTSGIVSQIDLGSRVFRAGAMGSTSDAFFQYGGLKFTTGQNSGKLLEVKGYVDSTRQFEMFLSFPFPITIGDQFDVYPGCDKIIYTCRDKFNNEINFRGEPYIPGIDKATSYANSLGNG